MNHTDFYARIRAIKEMEYRELYAAIELHGASYEWNEGVSKCAPSFFMHKAPTFTSRGFVIT